MKPTENNLQVKPPTNTARKENGSAGSWDGWNFSDWHKNPVPLSTKAQPSKAFFPPDRENYKFQPDYAKEAE